MTDQRGVSVLCHSSPANRRIRNQIMEKCKPFHFGRGKGGAAELSDVEVEHADWFLLLALILLVSRHEEAVPYQYRQHSNMDS